MSKQVRKVLFVHSGNSKRFPVSPFLRAQADSLEAKGVRVDFFPVVGKGLAYLRNVKPLRARIKESGVDLVHAHYSLCGWVSVLAFGGKPVVLSIMGDDAQGTFIGKGQRTIGGWFFVFLTWSVQPFLDAVIYKSRDLGRAVWRRGIGHWLPNGVRLDQFHADRTDHRDELGLEKSKKHVLFLGDPTDPNKNIALAREAVARLGGNVVLQAPHGIPHDMVVKYMKSADVFVLCSFGEGSPNVIKEAMACDRPIVTTPVGDAPWVLGDTPGCHVASYDPDDFAEKIALALRHEGPTRGRQRLIELGLDASTIADRLIGIYQDLIHH